MIRSINSIIFSFVSSFFVKLVAQTEKNGTALVLRSNGGWKPAMLINSSGEQEQLACFERDDNTGTFGSCSVTWQNRFHVFGGMEKGGMEHVQISRLNGYKLDRIGNLTFDHAFGACSVMNNQFIFLCFHVDWNISSNNYKRCRRSTGPLENFSEITLANYHHRDGKTGCSDSKLSCLISQFTIIPLAVLVAVGSSSPNNIQGEKFEDGAWSDIQDPPISSRLTNSAVIFDAGSFYYFGGYGGYSGSAISSILRLNADTWSWSNVGNLNSARGGHGAILVESTFMVFGGQGTKPNEACILNNGQFTCEAKTSNLTDYHNTPLLFLVSESYKLC